MRRFEISSGRLLAITVSLLALVGGLSFATFASRPALASAACTSTRSSNDADEQSLVGMVNAWRSSNNLSTLTPTAAFTRAAVSKSSEMAASGVFAHDDIMTTMARFNACGNSSTNIGENIAAGNTDPASTFAQWKNSPEHNANMLSTNFHAIGIGRAMSSSGYAYWTTEFGNVVDSAVTGSAPLPSNTAPLPSNTGQPFLPPTVPSGGLISAYGQGFFPAGGGNLPCAPSVSANGQASSIGFGFFGSGPASCSFVPQLQFNLPGSIYGQGSFPGGQPLPFVPPPSGPSNQGEGFFP